jgi:hypothetical protein
MSEREKFRVTYKFRGYTHFANIIGKEVEDKKEINFEVWEGGQYLFTLQPLADEFGRLCWTIEGGFIDQDATSIQAIGDAIDWHYL